MGILTKAKALAARVTMTSEDVRALLEKDHDEAVAIAKQICEAKTASRRAALFAKLKPALAAHSRAEEKVVYDALLALKRAEDAHGIANEGYVEHGLLDELLAGLARTTATSDSWKAKAKVLKELLEHHVKEEQSDMFADLGSYFSSDDLVAMGARFTREKNKLLAGTKARRSAKSSKTAKTSSSRRPTKRKTAARSTRAKSAG